MMNDSIYHLSSQHANEGLLVQLLNRASTVSTASYLATFVALAIFICTSTRILTSLRCTLYSDSNGSLEKQISVLPYWIPYIGHSWSFFTKFQGFLGEIMAKAHDGVFSLILANSKVHILYAPSLVNQFLNVHAPVNSRNVTLMFMEKAWNDGGIIRAMDQEVVFGPIHKALFQLNREPFVTLAVGRLVESVQKLTGRLVDFDSGARDLDRPLWERSGHVKFLKGESKTAEASLYPLIRDFVGSLALPTLMGEAFCRNYPNTLTDLWAFDSKINLLMAGLPQWLASLIPSIRTAINARVRLSESVAEFQDALSDLADKKKPTERWGDMSDVSNVMLGREQAWRRHNCPRAASGPGDASVMWAMMVNANQVIFWMVWYIYSSQSGELLKEIREEIRDFVKINQSTQDLMAAPELTIDMDGLVNQCPLLHSTFLETMRKNTASVQFKTVQQDFTVTESAEDAQILGKSPGPQKYTVPQGSTVVIPHGAHQMDKKYWKAPKTFDARRFLVEREDQKTSVDYGTMKVWGGGPTVCKGQKFAEREVMLFVAAIVMLWDLEPVDHGGKWVYPGGRDGSGTQQPLNEVNVRLTRRQLV